MPGERLSMRKIRELLRLRYGDDRAGCELTIGADVDPAAKRRGW
jgi:hypothetical protein